MRDLLFRLLIDTRLGRWLGLSSPSGATYPASALCRLGWHRFDGLVEEVRDDSIARGYGGVVVLEAGYYRHYCSRRGCAAADDDGRRA